MLHILPRTSGALVLAAVLAALAPLSTHAAPARNPKAKAGDCVACHGAQTVLPAGHAATKDMTFADCAKCHAPKTATALGGKLPSGHLHALNGVSCAQCHGTAKKYAPVELARCASCHGDPKQLAEKTANVKPENPHVSPHWGTQMECNVCHRQHEPTVNWCANCHNMDVKVP